MTDSFIYGRHPERTVHLNDTELRIIASSTIPIHIFWNILLRIQPDRWPENRRYPSASGNSITGVFVTYQSTHDPLSSLGTPGDIWITPTHIYCKEIGDRWTLWYKRLIYRCPYEPQRILAWTRNAHFKYLLPKSIQTERRRWDLNKVPLSCIPTQVRKQSSDVVSVIHKDYRHLREEDCVLLLNARCDLMRGRKMDEVMVGGISLQHTPGSHSSHPHEEDSLQYNRDTGFTLPQGSEDSDITHGETVEVFDLTSPSSSELEVEDMLYAESSSVISSSEHQNEFSHNAHEVSVSATGIDLELQVDNADKCEIDNAVENLSYLMDEVREHREDREWLKRILPRIGDAVALGGDLRLYKRLDIRRRSLSQDATGIKDI